jgi:hypothetical protein
MSAAEKAQAAWSQARSSASTVERSTEQPPPGDDDAEPTEPTQLPTASTRPPGATRPTQPSQPDSDGTQRDAAQAGSGGGRTAVIVAAAVGVVVIVAAAVFVVNRGDAKTADPGASPSAPPSSGPGANSSAPTSTAPTDPASTQSNGQGTFPPGQSKNPKLHEGARISSDAISFARRQPPWSDRKRLVPQLLNSSGQYVLLQENFDGRTDWYADIFVGAVGTSTPFNGNVQATASDLSSQVRTEMYRDTPATVKPLSNGPVQRTGKPGWYYQQSVTANSPNIAARVLTLTVAVFDLGDGTAVAYISDIPTNRSDLRTAESQVYKGINVG